MESDSTYIEGVEWEKLRKGGATLCAAFRHIGLNQGGGGVFFLPMGKINYL